MGVGDAVVRGGDQQITISSRVSRPRLLYLVTEDWYFCSHRLPIARAARDAGFEMVVATRVGYEAERIQDEGFRLVSIGMSRRGRSPPRELATLAELVRLYRSERPDLTHHVAMKPVIYGSIAARLAAVPATVNAFAGLGFVFLSSNPQARLLRPVVKLALRTLLNGSSMHTVVQNPDDAAVIQQLAVPSARIAISKGSGIDVDHYQPRPEMDGPSVVTLVSRMLWDKGVGELVEASRILKRWGVKARFWLVGVPDPENPASISEEQLRSWHDEGIVEWLQHRTDIASIWAQSHIAVLPSYREGLPKSILEAAACGRPVVTTDVPGCREVVQEGENGLIVPVKDPDALALAITKLAGDVSLRARMGKQGRKIVVREFSETTVIDQTLTLYRNALAQQ